MSSESSVGEGLRWWEEDQSDALPDCSDRVDQLAGEFGHLSVGGCRSDMLPVCRECYHGMVEEIGKMKAEVARHRSSLICLLKELTDRSTDLHNMVRKVGEIADGSFFKGYEACTKEVERVFPDADIGLLAPSPIDASSSDFYKTWYQVSSDSEPEN